MVTWNHCFYLKLLKHGYFRATNLQLENTENKLTGRLCTNWYNWSGLIPEAAELPFTPLSPMDMKKYLIFFSLKVTYTMCWYERKEKTHCIYIFK